VILPRGLDIDGLDDSKKLSPAHRDALFGVIVSRAVAYGIASATVAEIEKLNILGATFLAMNRAVAELSVIPALALIDGDRDKGIKASSRCIVGGDGKCASIAAASILAKVARDRYMLEMDEKYPAYGFGQHKGYGTAAHYTALREFGPCEIHRMSFLKKMH
jgi:ribonuclease HII